MDLNVSAYNSLLDLNKSTNVSPSVSKAVFLNKKEFSKQKRISGNLLMSMIRHLGLLNFSMTQKILLLYYLTCEDGELDKTSSLKLTKDTGMSRSGIYTSIDSLHRAGVLIYEGGKKTRDNWWKCKVSPKFIEEYTQLIKKVEKIQLH